MCYVGMPGGRGRGGGREMGTEGVGVGCENSKISSKVKSVFRKDKH